MKQKILNNPLHNYLLLGVAAMLISVGMMAIGFVATLSVVPTGPIDIGTYSFTGPGTYTQFAGKAKVIHQVGDYKVWLRDDSMLGEGG